MAVIIPHRYKDKDFQVVISPAYHFETGEVLDDMVRCCVYFTPAEDKMWESDMKVSREFTQDPNFYNYACDQCIAHYERTIFSFQGR